MVTSTIADLKTKDLHRVLGGQAPLTDITNQPDDMAIIGALIAVQKQRGRPPKYSHTISYRCQSAGTFKVVVRTTARDTRPSVKVRIPLLA
jgi:hypothetical protein